MMQRLGMDEEEALESKMVTRAIEQAQQRVEAYNFDIRKRVVEYDDVMNNQRTVIYGERDKVLQGESMRDTILDMLEDEVEALAADHLGDASDPEAFRQGIAQIVPDLPDDALQLEAGVRMDAAVEAALDIIEDRYEALEDEVGEETQRLVERLVLLRTIDSMWVEHLTAVEDLRQGIGLRAFAQQDPLVAYKREAHDMWEQFRERIRQMVTRQVLRARLTVQAAAQQMQQEQAPRQVQTTGPGDPDGGNGATATAAPVSAGVAMAPPSEDASRAERRRYERAVQKAQKKKGKRG
jgi:preprotein translocase subunit SecA